MLNKHIMRKAAGILAALVIALSGLLVPTVAPAAQAQSSFTGVVEICTVTASSLNVRGGPGTTNPVTSAPALRRGQRVVILSSQAGWARHGDGGWSSRQFLNCANYTRSQVTPATLPPGYVLHETATAHAGGGRLPLYDALSTPSGETWQPWIPAETFRQGHDVSIVLPAGSYTFLGVACFIELDPARVGDNAVRNEVATHQNNGEFVVSSAGTWARVVCDNSDIAGFSVATREPGAARSTNSPYGSREAFVPNEEAGQWVMQAYDMNDVRLPLFDAVKEPNGDIWQPWLPDEATRSEIAFQVPVVLLEASFSFNGIVCDLFADESLAGVGTDGRRVAGRGNGQLFSIDTFTNNVFDDQESWGVAICDADPHSGFSVRRR